MNYKIVKMLSLRSDRSKHWHTSIVDITQENFADVLQWQELSRPVYEAIADAIAAVPATQA